MTRPYAEEIAANLERASQSLGAARELTGKGYYDIAASRAYYAAFYAASAALLAEGLELSKHSGVIASIRSTAIVTRLSACHSERSEESPCGTEIPRSQRALARNDKSEFCATASIHQRSQQVFCLP